MSDNAKKPKAEKQEFKDPSDVENVLKPMRDAEQFRADDRGKIDDLFNGKRPYKSDEVERFNIQVNVNWGEGKTIMRDANAQVNGALLHSGNLFNVSCLEGPQDKRADWGQTYTTELLRILQEGVSGREFYYTINDRNKQVCLHGVGPLLWMNDFKLIPRFVPMEDLLISTETYCSLKNARYFGVNVYLSPGELLDMTEGDNVQTGWNKEAVDGILEAMRKNYSEGPPPTWRDQPQMMRAMFKENRGFYFSDVLPKIRLTWFFYMEVDKPNKWYRVLIVREAYGDVKPSSKFIFDGRKTPFADDVGQILAIQYGDNNVTSPAKYHVVRGMGTDLYAPVETNNRLRCQFVQSVFEHLLMYFRIQDPQDRDRLKMIMLAQYGILPDGLNIVPRSERHEIDGNLVAEAMGQVQQIMQQSSSSFVRKVDDGNQKEMTAKEATIRLNQASQMVSAMVDTLYLQEAFLYNEMKRRACKRTTGDDCVKEFHKRCRERGIPEELLYDENAWKILPEKVLGGGDKSQAQSEAGWLWQNKEQFEPSVQPTLRRMVVTTLFSDPGKARMLVPMAKPESTDGTIAAENVFGTLMTGQECSMRKGIDLQGYIDRMLQMTASIVKKIQSTDNVGTIDDLIGLMAAVQNIGQHVAAFAASKANNQRVKQYGDAIGQTMNEVKGFQQRLSQKMQAQNEAAAGDPVANAKAKNTAQMGQLKLAINKANAELKLKTKAADFAMNQAHDHVKLLMDARHDAVDHHHQIFHDSLSKTMETLAAMRAAKRVDKNTVD